MIEIGVISERWLEAAAGLARAGVPYLILAGAVIAALALHRAGVWIMARLLVHDRSFAARAIRRTKRPTRLAFVAVALLIALSTVSLPFAVEAQARHLVAAMLIVLVGWAAVLLVALVSDILLSHYRLDVEDNLQARRQITQVRILRRTVQSLVVLFTIAAVLLTFRQIQQYGVSLLASAGAAGIILGLAAKPVLSNLIAGIQIAITQPIRIEDVVIVENEWGWIEEIGSSFVTVRLWDWRRLVVPLSYFVEQPFQNWTRESAAIIGEVRWHVDYGVPVGAVRKKFEELVAASPLWDRRVVNLQVVDSTGEGIQLRGLMSARNSPIAWDLRCEIREKLIDWLQAEYPEHLPRQRFETRARPAPEPARAAAE
ncbi:mechanosensitive ion channel family protein [Amaricoccus solimangrovi]|uniref:Mechanosensitive ion channel n=1 Tax=Amaricoccus solimangrovi TaxID=2589815 RepID=A0A501WRW9_9RHOB|nr:mechanosensitive ion channel domain-containing protein [Amaricoccus solimangrovi]TPE48516.1 mechanosensitive ion channel [Amaricoccus solimangrovi]